MAKTVKRTRGTPEALHDLLDCLIWRLCKLVVEGAGDYKYVDQASQLSAGKRRKQKGKEKEVSPSDRLAVASLILCLILEAISQGI